MEIGLAVAGIGVGALCFFIGISFAFSGETFHEFFFGKRK